MANSKSKPSATAKVEDDEPQPESNTDHMTEPDQTEEWVFTVNSLTGEIAKVERVEKAGNERHELSEEEYAALSAYAEASYDQDSYNTYAEQHAAEIQSGAAYEAGYNQAMAEYAAQQATENQSGAYEAGYNQAMAEYAAQQDAESQYNGLYQAGYYQGVSDYEAALSAHGLQPG